MMEIKSSARHVEDEIKVPVVIDNVIKDARTATEKEHNMGLWKAFKLYPKAAGWSILISTAIIMEGFDAVLIGSFYGYPAFNRKYGRLLSDGSYGLTAAWQAGLTNGMACGQILGLFLNGIVSEKFGYRKTMMGSLIATTAFIFILFFAQNVQTLLIGEILLGIPLGVYQTLSVTYASEVCPVSLRAYFTTYVNLCWVIGQFIAAGILKGLSGRTDQWAYRIPFALQWIWPIPIFIGVVLAPESPWWLVRQGRTEEAAKSLLRLTSKGDKDFDAHETVAMMVHTNEMEKEIVSGTSYLDCFRGYDLRRTEITCMIWAVQNLCGATLMAYSNVFYQRAGLAVSESFTMSLGQYAIGFVGTVLSWVLMSYIGRRPLYVYGLAILCALLLIVRFISIAPETPATGWATGSMLLVYTFFYDCTVGPVCYALVSEMSTTRLRIKTVVLARNVYNCLSIFNNVITPYMLNVDAWNWRGKAGFFWGGSAFLCFVWAYFRVPEPRGRTYAEMDALFEMKVPARKFASTQVHLFHEDAVTATDEKKSS
jgi:SP family general alpha glucoside:H+ symporter-like MFS transporter